MKRAPDGRCFRGDRKFAPLLPGPTSLDEVLDVFAYTSRALHRHATSRNDIEAVTEAVQSKLDLGYVLTSTYAGLGSDLAVGTRTVRVLEELLGLDKTPIVCHSAWDCWEVARRCLDSHVNGSRPNRCFPEILDRLFEIDFGVLKKIEQQFLRRFRVAMRTHESADRAEILELKETIGRRYVRALRKHLHTCSFRDTAYCVTCGQPCPISPRKVPGLENAYVLGRDGWDGLQGVLEHVKRS